MAGSIAIPQSKLLIYGVCLPLAVLIGYVLAPMDRASIALVLLIAAALSVPVLMKWHHPWLVFSWNSVVALAVLPMTLCMALTFISIFFSILNRAIGRQVTFFEAPGVARSLICLAIVVIGTAYINGGVGLHAFGSSVMGGGRYVSILAAILCYFALACRRIEPEKAPLYTGLFWLSALVGFIGYAATLAGPNFSVLNRIFGAEPGLMGDSFYGNSVIAPETGLLRMGSAGFLGTAVFCYLAARFGIRGIFDLRRPWRLLAFIAAFIGVVGCSYRSHLVFFTLTFCCVFYLEGLFRFRYVLTLLVAFVVLSAALLPFTRRLPISVQRTLSVLPVEVDPIVRDSADGSTQWRLDMWEQLLPQVPRYFFKGKGYGLDAHDLYESLLSKWNGTGFAAEGAMISGDYHSGPFSVIIPLGIYGVVAFVWFLCASVRVLYRNYRYGDPALKTLNTLLLAYFLVRIFTFVFVFGSLYSDLVAFCGVIGFAVSLNGVAAPAPPAEPSELSEAEELVEAEPQIA